MTDPRYMDADHTTPRALGGGLADRIICRRCNRSAGATFGNLLRQGRVAVPRQSRNWTGR